jgi:6-phosphofructokinase 1
MEPSSPARRRLAILVGGGPAPGINGVIHSAAIEAINNGIEVVGILDGFEHLMQGGMRSRRLAIEDVSRIHLRGGSILRTSRANPTKKEADLDRCADVLVREGIDYLLAIGGDDTAYSAYRVARHAQETRHVAIQVAHVPKTIDNDLPLPDDIRTFGYETARELGTRTVMNLMEEALTGRRWILVVTMGRKTGHLALGIGKSAGATVTLIPEEWGERPIRLQEVPDILAGSIIKRLAQGKEYGVAVVAEGLVEQMTAEDLDGLKDAPRDTHGHIQLSEINFSDVLKGELHRTLKEIGINLRLINKDLGFELRSADPIAFDIDYTIGLGEAAVSFLLTGGTNATITIQRNQVVPITFESMIDPVTGRTQVRHVNLDSFTYRSAYKFMIRLKPQDAHDEDLLARMAARTKLLPEAFKARFGYLMGIAPRPF